MLEHPDVQDAHVVVLRNSSFALWMTSWRVRDTRFVREKFAIEFNSSIIRGGMPKVFVKGLVSQLSPSDNSFSLLLLCSSISLY